MNDELIMWVNRGTLNLLPRASALCRLLLSVSAVLVYSLPESSPCITVVLVSRRSQGRTDH